MRLGAGTLTSMMTGPYDHGTANPAAEPPTDPHNDQWMAQPSIGITHTDSADANRANVTDDAAYSPYKRLRQGQRAAVEALALGMHAQDAASLAGVGERTLRKWRTEPVFLDALDHALRLTTARAYDRLRSKADHVVERLLWLVDNGDRDNRTQLDAAALVLAHVYGQPSRRAAPVGQEGGASSGRTVTVTVEGLTPPTPGHAQRWRVAAQLAEGVRVEEPAPADHGPGDRDDGNVSARDTG